MSRSLERLDGAPTAGTLADILTVPAGHKYELTDVSVDNDQVHLYTYYLFAHVGAGYPQIDEIAVTPPRTVEHRLYNGWPLYAGEKLTCYVLLGAGATYPPTCSVSYVDVNYLT